MQPDRDRIIRAALVSIADDIATLSEQGMPIDEIADHFTYRMELAFGLAGKGADKTLDKDAP